MSPIGSLPGREDDILRIEAARRLSSPIVNSYPPGDQDTRRIARRQLLFVLVMCLFSIQARRGTGISYQLSRCRGIAKSPGEASIVPHEACPEFAEGPGSGDPWGAEEWVWRSLGSGGMSPHSSPGS